MIDLKIDDYIADNSFLLSLFKNISPNCITITGIIINFIIPYQYQKNNIKLVNILLILRYFSDILDGAVARKYNNVSKLGGYLDTTNDFIFMTIYSHIITYSITKNINWARFSFFMTPLFLYTYFNANNILYDHENLKKTEGLWYQKLFAFITNNSILIYILFGVLNSYNYLKFKNW